MSKEVIQTCDRCKKSYSDKNDKKVNLVTVSVCRNDRQGHYSEDHGVVWRRTGGIMSADWCPACLAEMQLDADPPKPKEGEHPTPVSTIDDIIREMIVEEVDGRINN